ncbi:MAG: hypothetical protein LLF90_01175 [Methanomicrobiaceae archaeon]|uniref:hypothetical protein n=1 Tax=Methanoculleus sp. TaxID=90427 RepID=UPI00321122FF|nr:hypothetical protein [Methanomicrobiaceae archaeon]
MRRADSSPDEKKGGSSAHDPEVPVSLEYRRPAEFYASQVAVFDAIYQKYS